MRTPSFSDHMRAGWPKEKLMKYYAMSEREYEKVFACVQRIHAEGVKS